MGMARVTLIKSTSNRASNLMKKSISLSNLINTIVMFKKKSRSRSNKRTTKFII
jgi:hypothetical protein